MSRCLLALLCVFLSLPALALDKPNTFADGQTASANAVNENFDAVFARMPALYDANGALVGTLVSAPFTETQVFVGLSSVTTESRIEFKIYVPSINKFAVIYDKADEGRDFLRAYYANSSCSGDVYAVSSQVLAHQNPYTIPPNAARVVKEADGSTVGYVASFLDTTPQFSAFSKTGMGCMSESFANDYVRLSLTQTRPATWDDQFVRPFVVR